MGLGDEVKFLGKDYRKVNSLINSLVDSPNSL